MYKSTAIMMGPVTGQDKDGFSVYRYIIQKFDTQYRNTFNDNSIWIKSSQHEDWDISYS
jgi:hypothetical protein